MQSILKIKILALKLVWCKFGMFKAKRDRTQNNLQFNGLIENHARLTVPLFIALLLSLDN